MGNDGDDKKNQGHEKKLLEKLDYCTKKATIGHFLLNAIRPKFRFSV